MNPHLIFYDGECPLCNRAIRFLLAADKKKQFLFAPLQGKTAAQKLKHLQLKKPDLDTLILLDTSGKIWIEGRGVLRICWLLGSGYTFLGSLSFLPPYLFDFFYRLIARNRYRLFGKHKVTIPPDASSRFLP